MSDATVDPLPPEERKPLKATVTVNVPHELMTWADDWGKRHGRNRGQVVTEALEELRALEEPGR